MNILFSYNWLRYHFEKDIPTAEEISELFMKHLCEVEGMEKKVDDTIFDLKIMPDRGHDLLAHKGIANEISVLSGVPLSQKFIKSIKFIKSDAGATLRVSIEDSKLCPRYMGCVVDNIKVGESPTWLRERLESVGQRSINNIVDITNYVMLEIGQPMHAFDLSKLASADIFVRKAKDGEKLTTLDGKYLTLTPETLVIADEKQVLAIAGVKGGKDAGVDETTTSIVFESANFNAVNTRKTAQRVGIRTDSSKRFEHDISPAVAEEAMELATSLIIEMCPDAKVGEMVDVYPEPQKQYEVTISLAELNGILGTSLSEKETTDILARLGFSYTCEGLTFAVAIPPIRLDLRIKEDLAEEIGRVYGFDKVPDTPIPDIAFKAEPLKAYYYANLIRDILVANGFSEVFTYSFQKEGVFAVANPIASDKGFLRTDLATGIKQALELNARNAPLLGLDEIKIFEIGKVFPGVMVEKLSCAFGIQLVKANKKKDQKVFFEEIAKTLSDVLGVEITGTTHSNIFEFDLGAILEKLPVPEVGAPFNAVAVRYIKPSAYPFMLRDIALWVPEKVTSDVVIEIIANEAGELLRTKRLFDVFTKEIDGIRKTSYAFNLVFQSDEKTLSDDEVNVIMNRVQSALVKEGYEVR